MSAIYTLGIDVGSTASKCIMLKDGQEIVAKSLIDVGAGTSGPQRAIDAVLENAGMKKEDMAFTLATGYGRNSLMNFADKQMSELSCHARGAYFLFPDVHTVIDIGGQDVKVLHIDNGAMTNFQMNDMIQLYHEKSRPAYCAKVGMVDEIVDMTDIRPYIQAFTEAAYQNPKSICPMHQMVTPRAIREWNDAHKA